MPEVRTTDGVKDNVHALAREAMNFLHKVLMLVINRHRPRSETAGALGDEQVPYSPVRRGAPAARVPCQPLLLRRGSRPAGPV